MSFEVKEDKKSESTFLKSSRNVITITDKDSVFYFFLCPHCDGGIIVLNNEVACKIFRHAVIKPSCFDSTFPKSCLVNPHESKDNIDKLISTGAIYGCGRPIRMTNDFKSVEICDYI